MTKIILTAHAIDRYQERVRPTLSREQAGDELEQLALVARRVDKPPFAHHSGEVDEADGFLVISDGVALLMVKNRALTCLTRAGVAGAQRKHRNDKKRQAKRNRRDQLKSDHHGRISRQKRNQVIREDQRKQRRGRDA